MKKRSIALLMTAAMAVSLLAGCSNGTTSEAPPAEAPADSVAETAEPAAEPAAEPEEEDDGATDGESYLFGVTYWIESDFFKTIADSITEQAEANGHKTVVVDASQDSAKQIQIIEDFITQGVDAVFLNPVDKDGILPALQLLNNAGIPIINFDSSVGDLSMVDAYVATDNLYAGVLCGEAMIADFPDGGDIAVLNFPANGACVDREQGFLDTIEGHGFNIVATYDAEGTVELGQSITSDILQANPNLDAIFSINDQAGMGAYAAITTVGGDTAIYGVDGNPEAKSVIAEGGIYKMSSAQSPLKIGVEAYNVAILILGGGTPAEFQIDVPAFAIDGSNVDDYLAEPWQ